MNEYEKDQLEQEEALTPPQPEDTAPAEGTAAAETAQPQSGQGNSQPLPPPPSPPRQPPYQSGGYYPPRPQGPWQGGWQPPAGYPGWQPGPYTTGWQQPQWQGPNTTGWGPQQPGGYQPQSSRRRADGLDDADDPIVGGPEGKKKKHRPLGVVLKLIGAAAALAVVTMAGYGIYAAATGENPLDYPALEENPGELLVVATNALTGSPKYFDKSDIRQDCYDICKASSAIPFVCNPYEVGWMPYYDGALSDPVPVQKAFDAGCDKVVVVLTRPADVLREPGKDLFIQHRYPFAANKLRTRAQRYNEGVALAREYAARGRALIVAPDDTCGIDTLTREKDALIRFYHKGYEDAKAIEGFVFP